MGRTQTNQNVIVTSIIRPVLSKHARDPKLKAPLAAGPVMDFLLLAFLDGVRLAGRSAGARGGIAAGTGAGTTGPAGRVFALAWGGLTLALIQRCAGQAFALLDCIGLRLRSAIWCCRHRRGKRQAQSSRYK